MTEYKGTGGQILAHMLSLHGVDHVACVAGESYLAVLDALLDQPQIAVTTCRQEGGAAFIAESRGKISGRPGICFVTRGPGACNAAIGVHTAMQDSTPMILFVGQIGRHDRGREAFQEIDIREVFGGLAKWTAEITEAARIPETIHRAFRTAQSGRPGPVVIGLPEDMLREWACVTVSAPSTPIEAPAVSKDTFARLKEYLRKAQNPVAIIGGSTWTDEGCADFMRFAAACHLPVATSFRRQDLFDHKCKNYIGELGTGPNPALVNKIKNEADLVIAIGTRLNEITTGDYSLLSAPYPRQDLIHIHPAELELGKVYAPALAIQADINHIARSLPDLRIDGRRWAGWQKELRALYDQWSAIPQERLDAGRNWRGADMTAIFEYLRTALPDNAIITTDAGNFSGWAQRYLYYGRPGRLLAPISGAMGYAVPAAISAALYAPDRLVAGFCGDGGFMMNGQELATAIHHGAKPIIVICNNGMYGTIRMHQERDYPGRVSATALTNPDFIRLAESYGALALRAETAEDFPEIWQDAISADQAVVIEICMDPRQITTATAPPAGN